MIKDISYLKKGVDMKTGGMKVLLFDIETAPNLAYVWGKYEQNVISFVEEHYMLSFAYMWLDDEKVKVKALPDYKGYKPNKCCDKALVKDLWDLFNTADVVVAHNGNAFDIKMANGFFMRNGMPPPKPFKTIDTLLVARNKCKFNSNKLDDLGDLLGLGRKVNTGGFGLWLGCMQGDKKAWTKMKKYNGQDVVLLKKVYLKLRPWMTNHPNFNLLKEDAGDACPVCLGVKLHNRGYGYTLTTKYKRYQCQNCGKWSRGKTERTDVQIR